MALVAEPWQLQPEPAPRQPVKNTDNHSASSTDLAEENCPSQGSN